MKHNEVYLKHILDEITFLLKSTEKLDYISFVESEMFTRAFSRSFEIIGEAVKNLSPDFRKTHKDIEWKKISGMRDKIIHQYFSVDYELLWDAIKNKLPEIQEKIQILLTQSK
ncbi:MAG: DUF86 domain-containing protein [Ignavibacteriaceae bacterium]|nr:DUF86 domain-containing protein [Ignavibacteriaceae bacterium]